MSFISECCGAVVFDYPDNDICSDCKEHCEAYDEDEEICEACKDGDLPHTCDAKCDLCGGTGESNIRVSYYEPDFKPCPKCKGSGEEFDDDKH